MTASMTGLAFRSRPVSGVCAAISATQTPDAAQTPDALTTDSLKADSLKANGRLDR